MFFFTHTNSNWLREPNVSATMQPVLLVWVKRTITWIEFPTTQVFTNVKLVHQKKKNFLHSKEDYLNDEHLQLISSTIIVCTCGICTSYKLNIWDSLATQELHLYICSKTDIKMNTCTGNCMTDCIHVLLWFEGSSKQETAVLLKWKRPSLSCCCCCALLMKQNVCEDTFHAYSTYNFSSFESKSNQFGWIRSSLVSIRWK